MSLIPPHKLRVVLRHIERNGVIAYPTEAVFGLGCDPDNIHAIRTILDLKNRPIGKGLILIAADFEQLTPYIDTTDIPDINRVLKTWPGPVTWLIKARSTVSVWLRGEHESVAVRVTAHPVASQLARAFGKPLVSTSANPTGFAPAKSALKTRRYFARTNILIVGGAIGQERGTTAIIDARSNAQLR